MTDYTLETAEAYAVGLTAAEFLTFKEDVLRGTHNITANVNGNDVKFAILEVNVDTGSAAFSWLEKDNDDPAPVDSSTTGEGTQQEMLASVGYSSWKIIEDGVWIGTGILPDGGQWQVDRIGGLEVLGDATLDYADISASRHQKITVTGRRGGSVFLRDESDLSAEVSADPEGGIVVPFASDITGASGGYVRQVTGEYFYEWFGYPVTAASMNAALAVAPLYSTVAFAIGGEIHTIDDEVVVDRPLNLDHHHAVMKKVPSYTGYLLSFNGLRYGIPSDPVVNALDTQPAWKTQIDLSAASFKNAKLEGDFRQTVGFGIIFRGGNSKFHMTNVQVDNFLGTGIAACDPDGSTGLDATNSYMQESTFKEVSIKSCGSPGNPSYLIGRNANGASNHNNLRHISFEVVYPRDEVGIRVVNKNASARIQNLIFGNQLFVHGNRQLDAATQPAEASVDASSDLIHIGGTGNVGQLRYIYFNDARILDQGHGSACVRIESEADVKFSDCEISSAVAGTDPIAEPIRSGVVLNNAGRVLFHGLQTLFHPEQVYIEAITTGSAITFGANNVDEPAGIAAPNVRLAAGVDESRILDLSQVNLSHSRVADVDALDAEDSVMGILPMGGRVIRAYVIPAADITAGPSNFQRIIIRPYNVDGSTRPISTTSGQNDTWIGLEKKALTGPVMGDLLTGTVVASFLKNGPSGILISQCVVEIEVSQQLWMVRD